MGKKPVPQPAERPLTREYKPSKVTKAKAGRRATTLARVNRADGKARESDAAKKAWKKSEKKGAALKAAEKKAWKRSSLRPRRRQGAKKAAPEEDRTEEGHAEESHTEEDHD